MITLFVEENNPLTPNFYNDLINSLQFHQLKCPCGHSGCLSVHSYYNQSIKLPYGKVTFRICPVIYEHCGHTHAILLSSMVPYSQVSTSNQISIINNYSNGFQRQGCYLTFRTSKTQFYAWAWNSRTIKATYCNESQS